jgi:hypothetical protein
MNFCRSVPEFFSWDSYSPFRVPAKVTKLIGLKYNRILSPINLVTFAGTQNGQIDTVNRGGFAQSLNFKHLYKNHCKSNELLWAVKGFPIIYSS